MLTKERLILCALTPFPWGGITQKLQKLKGQSILSVLFKEPHYYDWVLRESGGEFSYLGREMMLLVDAIFTINPIKTCSEGNTLSNWMVSEGRIVGNDTVCADSSCKCWHQYCADDWQPVPYSFNWMFQFLDNKGAKRAFLEAFKRDYGLQKHYNETAFLKWLIKKARLKELEVA